MFTVCIGTKFHVHSCSDSFVTAVRLKAKDNCGMYAMLLFYNIKYFYHWYIIETLSNTCFQKFFASSTNHRFIELQARAIFIFEQSLLEVRYELFAGNLPRKYEF